MKAVRAAMGLLASACLTHLASCDAVTFDLNLSWEDREVAGAVRKTILVNGQFPGPTLRMKQGDDVQVFVNNSMPFGTTVHWHGIEQLGTPWSDGVPGLSQENIPPGGEFLYKWKAVDYGAYIYHSHSRGHIDDGLYGAIVIDPDDCVEKPFDKITQDPDELEALRKAEYESLPIIMSDWHPMTSEEIWRAEEVTGMENWCVSAILINGKGSMMCLPQDRINELTTDTQKQAIGNQTMTDMGCFPPLDGLLGSFDRKPELAPPGFYKDCIPGDGPTERFEVDPAAKYRSWDLISMASVSTLVFSVDEHPMYVYRVDGRYIEPLRVDAVTVPIGTRYSVFTKLDQQPGDYTVRVANTEPNQNINGTAIMSYTTSTQEKRGPSRASITETGTNATATTVMLNETNVVPFPAVKPAAVVDQTFVLNVGHYNSSYQWEMGNDTYSLSLEEISPVLFNMSSMPSKYTINTRNGTWVDLIVNITTSDQPAHPIHKHSNKFFVIGSGTSAWNYSSVAEAMQQIPQNFNLENPQMRDTFNTPSPDQSTAWLALRYQVVNPGAFLLHCHFQTHLSGGMALAILDGVDAWPQVPEGYRLPVVES
ncbi:multicopper oxidase-domain-containing protein [Aspergillus ambiguus]|uniref:multicopper oxidase-domain-containing protein n=1 Tax=Aspergillus ambiguus TaxID=176160 RepID=UPI003CCD4160